MSLSSDGVRRLIVVVVSAASLALGCVGSDFLDDPYDPSKTDSDGDGKYKEDGDCDDTPEPRSV